MRSVTQLLVAAAALVAQSANAVVVGQSNVALGLSPTAFTFPTASFQFSYDAAAAARFDPATYSVQTFGTGQTSAFGGFLGIPVTPSLFDTRGITIDGDLFPSYASFPELSSIPYSLVPRDLALRYGSGSDFYYGYARLNGNGTLDFAFESTANTAITAGAAITGPLTGAVPEPATWGMMMLGFGIAGCGIRRQRSARSVAKA